MKRLWFDTRGSGSVESVLWISFYFFMIAIVVDATILLTAQSRMWSIASDASRLVALRKLTPSEAENLILSNAGDDVVYEPDVNVVSEVVITTISQQFSNASALGFFALFGAALSVTATYRLEPEI